MAIVNSVISWVLKKRQHQIDLFMKYPIEVQQEWFNKLITAGKNTEFGKKHAFQYLRTREQYASFIPIQDYESLKDYILRVKHGEQNLIWPTEVKWFAKSSGTTSDKSKFIPVSKESLEDCHYKGGKDLLSIYFRNHPDSKLFDGKGLVIGGSSEVNQFGRNSYYGDLSSIIIKNLPYWAEYVRTPSKDIALHPEWEEKIEKMAHAGLQENVTNISGVPSWNLTLLNRILELSGKKNLLEVWPNFEMYAHGGVNFAPYKRQFKELFPSDNVCYLQTYNASEGFFGIQDQFDRNADDMLLMLDYGIYYEFIPMHEVKKEQPKIVLLEDVELDTDYAVVISTNAGLWRYQLGDTIRFTSRYPFRIKVSGRTKYYINAFGEELVAENAESALETATEKTNSVVADYTAAPFFEGRQGGHEWLIEFDKEPKDMEYFTEVLDNALKNINSDYEAKRYHDMNMLMPRVKKLEKGTFYNWLKSKGKLGGQNKVPRLSNERDTIESVLSVANQQ